MGGGSDVRSIRGHLALPLAEDANPLRGARRLERPLASAESVRFDVELEPFPTLLRKNRASIALVADTLDNVNGGAYMLGSVGCQVGLHELAEEAGRIAALRQEELEFGV